MNNGEKPGNGTFGIVTTNLFPQVKSAPEGIRTPNLLIRSQMLYPLSYGRRSIQLCARRTGRWRRREDLNLRSP